MGRLRLTACHSATANPHALQHLLTCRQALWVDVRLSISRLLPFFGHSKVDKDLCVSVGGECLSMLWMAQQGRGTNLIGYRNQGIKAEETQTCVLAPRPLASSQG